MGRTVSFEGELSKKRLPSAQTLAVYHLPDGRILSAKYHWQALFPGAFLSERVSSDSILSNFSISIRFVLYFPLIFTFATTGCSVSKCGWWIFCPAPAILKPLYLPPRAGNLQEGL